MKGDKNLISECIEWCQLQDGFLQMSETCFGVKDVTWRRLKAYLRDVRAYFEGSYQSLQVNLLEIEHHPEQLLEVK